MWQQANSSFLKRHSLFSSLVLWRQTSNKPWSWKFCVKAVVTKGSGLTHLFQHLKTDTWITAGHLLFTTRWTRLLQPTNTRYKAGGSSTWWPQVCVKMPQPWARGSRHVFLAKNVLNRQPAHLMSCTSTNMLYLLCNAMQYRYGTWSVFIIASNLTCYIYVYKSILSKRDTFFFFKRMHFYLFFQVSSKLHCLQWQG